jgi:hypothetical protein
MVLWGAGQGHNASWWGVALAIAALLLMIPANVFANALTPKVLNWWASRSKASLKERITALIKKLEEYKALPELTLTEDIILFGINGLFLMFAISFLVLLSLTITPGVNLDGGVRFLVGFIGLLGDFVSLVIHGVIQRYWEARSPSHRAKLAREIVRLTKELDRK